MSGFASTIEQQAFLDLNGRELNAAFVDAGTPLFVANNPLHWRAHKLQIAIERMEMQQQRNPAQFNATVYFAAIDKQAELMELINKQRGNGAEILDSGRVAAEREPGAAPSNGEVEPISMDT